MQLMAKFLATTHKLFFIPVAKNFGFISIYMSLLFRELDLKLQHEVVKVTLYSNVDEKTIYN